MSDEAEDPRHETPYKLKSGFALLPILSNVAEAIDKGWLGAYADEVSVLLHELRTRLNREQESAVITAQESNLLLTAEQAIGAVLNELNLLREAQSGLRPKPEFLAYADPAGKFECNPAGPAFTGESLTVLELRVLAAHLATALDNVNNELRKRV